MFHELTLRTYGPRQLLGAKDGQFVVTDDNGDWLGRWDTYGDAEAHQGEVEAEDPEACLEIYDLAEEAM